MEHTYIERNHVVERYVRNRLTEREHNAFEEHFLSCQRCLDDLQAAEGLTTGRKCAVANATSSAVARFRWIYIRFAMLRCRGRGC